MKSSFVFALAGKNDIPVYDGEWIDTVNAFSNEINLTLDSGPITSILGVSQFHKKNPFDKAFHIFRFGVNTRIPGSVEQSTFGIFNQTTVSITDSLRAIGGIRWSRESQNSQRVYYTINCPISSASFDVIFLQDPSTPGCSPPSVTPYKKGTWKNVSWKAGMEFDVNPDSLAYLSVTNGFKSGQVNPGPKPPLPDEVDPEEVINYEFGFKSLLLDRKLNIRFAAFNQDYKNIQVSNVTTVGNVPFLITSNAGKARIYGAELEWDYRPSDVDHLNGFISYTHATYRKFDNAQDGATKINYPSLKGNFLPNAPEFTIRGQYSHDFNLSNGGKITPLVAVYYQTKTYLREFNLPIDKQKCYSKTNMSLTYQDPSERWTASAYVTNLENKAVRNTVNTAINTYFSDYLAPRQFGVRLGYEF